MLPTMWKMKRDMEKLGIEFIEDGRRLDFHALRHTLGTNLSRQNIHPRVAMQLMRHSDIRLTMNYYTDVSGLPLADAINKMPAFTSLATHGDDTQIHTQNPDVMGTKQSPPDTGPPDGEPPKIIQPEQLWRDATLHDIAGHELEKSCLARTRT